MTRGRRVNYSDEELAWLEENQAWPRPVLRDIFVILFDRRELTVDHIKSLCTRKGWKAGQSGCFSKGIRPWNTGKRGYVAPGAEKGWFKKGQAPRNTKHLGHERVGSDGYVYVSIAERNPHTGYDRRYVFKHVHEWEKLNGPIPAEHCLKCLDGNKQNTDPSNWDLVHRGVLLRLNGGPNGRHLAFDAAAPEVRPALIAIAKLDHQARRRRAGGQR